MQVVITSEKIMKKYLLVILFLLFIPSVNAGQESALINSCKIFGLALGKNSLSDVESVLGPAKQIHIGDASTSEDIKCYHLDQGNNSVYLKFGSNAEMAGSPDYKLTSIVLSYSPFDFIKKAEVANVPLFNKELVTKSGLSLGITTKETEATLGEPTEVKDNKYVYSKYIKKYLPKDDKNYEYWSNKTGCFSDGESPYTDICFFVTIYFENSKAIKIVINRIESIC